MGNCVNKLIVAKIANQRMTEAAVGRASFELAKEFDLVTGIDFSARFIRVALQLKEKCVAHFELVEVGPPI